MNTATLSNNLKIVYQQTPKNPVSAAHFFFNQGTAGERENERGVTTLMWSLLLKGSKKRNARQLAEDLEAIGAHMSGGASHDNSHASCHAIADYFPKTLEIFAETFFNPTYLPAEVEKEKTALLAAIEAKKESIFSVAQDEMYVHLYHKHPYGIPTIGDKQTIPLLFRDQLNKRHKEIAVPNGTVLSLASPLPFKTLLPQIKRHFGETAWPKARTLSKTELQAPSKITKQMLMQKHPFEQAYLMIGFPAIPISSPDYVPLKLLAITLGGGMSSRLFQSLREERALAYDVGAYLAGRRKGSAFVIYMGLQHAKLDQAREEIFRELKRIQEETISKEELERVKSYFKGSFILDHQTNSQRSYYIGWSVSAGKGTNYDKDFLRTIEKITPASLKRVAQKYLGSSHITVEIVPK